MKQAGGPCGEQKQRHAPSWSQAASPPSFPTARIDLWKVSLDEPSKSNMEEGSQALLSPDEIARALRFHFEKDRLHFTGCRSALRGLLAKYLAIPAAEIRFEYTTSGKPRLAATQNPSALQFNVSHSAGMALIAIGSEHRLGIDIEKIRENVDVSALSERFFSLRERVGLRALPNHLRVPGFFACWTRKEAFLKATGDGLSFPLADFSVTTNPDLDPEIEEIRGNAEARKQWSLADLCVVDGYRSTLAVENALPPLHTYTYICTP